MLYFNDNTERLIHILIATFEKVVAVLQFN